MLKPSHLALGLTLAICAACGEAPATPLGPELSVTGNGGQTVMMVPFRAWQSQLPGDATGVLCPVGEAPGFATAEGQGTYLGDFTAVFVQCLNQAAGIWSRVDGTFTASNGDQLDFEMNAANFARVIFFNPSNGDFVSTGGLDITGGTGRFEGATGNMIFRSTGNVFVPGASTTLTGEISSPGSTD